MPLVITLSSGEARVVLGNAALLDIIGERLGPDMKEAVEAALIREREEGKEASWDELEDKEDRLAQILLLAERVYQGIKGDAMKKREALRGLDRIREIARED